MRIADKRRGILLDVGCRDRKEGNWLGIDKELRPVVDIVHDLERFPYPVDSDSCITIKAAHVLEHISPKLFFRWMDEMWRLLKPEGQLAISAPYAGSLMYWMDPTHVMGITEATFQYVDPDFPAYLQYKPKPWSIEHASWSPTGIIDAILRKRMERDENEKLAEECIVRKALQRLSELSRFFEFIRKYELRTVVEIGTAGGGLFWGLCQLSSPNAMLVSIDLPGGKFGGVFWADGGRQLKSFGKPRQKIEVMWKDSHDPSTLKELKSVLNGRSVDLLFIDGDHSYQGVKKDWEMYSPLVKKGGVVAFHDILFHPQIPECKVDRFWNQVKKGKVFREFTDQKDRDWGGIGVILK